MGSGQPYYPIDPWTLEGVLFNCAAISLKISKKVKMSFGAKLGAKSNIFLPKQFSIVSKAQKGMT